MEAKELPLDQIDVSRFNTRKDLTAGTEDSSLEDLAASIREKGLLNPVIVRPEELAPAVIKMVEQWRQTGRSSGDVKSAAKKLKI